MGMNEERQRLTDLFTEKAKLVSAFVSEVASMDEALAYVVDVCEKKEACQILASGCELPLSDKGEALCDTKQQKTIAAPLLDKEAYAKLSSLAGERGIRCIDSGLRQHLGGVDIGLTMADLGIAETGSLILNSNSEELRLSTMVSEFHVAVLPKSRIRETSYDIEADLVKMVSAAPSYTAFITGASRTADIERVLALGVHGPLQLHILLLED